MDITLSHHLSYTTKGDVPVSIVARSLLANERLIQESIAILDSYFDELSVEKINVKVSELSNASPLKEIFSIGLFLAFQEELNKEVPDIIQKLTGYNVPNSADTLVTVIVLIVAIYIIDATIQRLFPGKSNKQLQSEYEAKVADLAQLTELDVETIKHGLESRLNEGKSKTLFNKAYDFFMPAKIEQGTSIETDTMKGISCEAIAEIPTEIDFEQLESTITHDVVGAKIEIHRADIDFGNQGWLAVIQDQSQDRKKMILAKEFDPSSLYGKKLITGDVTVVEEKKIDGEYVIKEYHLIRIIGGSDDDS